MSLYPDLNLTSHLNLELEFVSFQAVCDERKNY